MRIRQFPYTELRAPGTPSGQNTPFLAPGVRRRPARPGTQAAEANRGKDDVEGGHIAAICDTFSNGTRQNPGPTHLALQLCRYLRHLPLRGPGNRPPRSSESRIGPKRKRNGTGVFANLDPEPRVFGVSGRKRRDSPETPHQNSTGVTLGKARKAGRGKELGHIYIYISWRILHAGHAAGHRIRFTLTLAPKEILYILLSSRGG